MLRLTVWFALKLKLGLMNILNKVATCFQMKDWNGENAEEKCWY